MLLGQTIEGMQAWDVRRAVQVVRTIPSLGKAPLNLEGSGAMAGIALYAGLFEPGISELALYDLPDTHRHGPILLNVRKIFDLPQAVAAALDSAGSVQLLRTGGTAENDWAWPRALAEGGHAAGTLHVGAGSPFLAIPSKGRD
jgi:hypothetical protein